ncbi:MAG: hypothetical protein ACUVTG_02180 [Candidatus Oleimicrobiaceae bacterium]
MINDCPLCLGCRLAQKVELFGDMLYIGQTVEAYAEQRSLRRGRLDVQKLRSFVLTVPDNTYWTLGEPVAKAWNVGRKVKLR